MESHSKHGELLFMEQESRAALLVTLYDDASVAWPVPGAAGVVATVTQRPVCTATELTVTASVVLAGGSGGPASFALALRVPGWADGASATVNGEPVSAAEGWFNVSRPWATSGDVVIAVFPFTPRLEALNDDRAQFAGFRAVTAGPFALGFFTHADNVVVGSASVAAPPPWVRPLSAAERARSFSLAAPGFPAGTGAYVRHDNASGLFASVLDLPSPPSGGNVSFGAPEPGFIGAGNDLISGNWSLAEAEAQCVALPACVSFTYHSADPSPPSGAVEVLLKASADFSAAAGWTSYISSRAGNPMGGDEDGPDATWILDGALTGAPGQSSVRSLNRPGDFIACGAVAAPCAIAHGASAAFNASASWILHSPGLSGAPGSVSLESAAAAGAFLSYFGGGPAPGGAVALSLLANQPGNAQFAAASTFSQAGAVWSAPPVTFVAETGDATVANSRNYLLMPIADFVSEYYGTYFNVASE